MKYSTKYITKRKLLILFLAICVLTTFMPTCAFAGENDTKIVVYSLDELQSALKSSSVNTIIIPYADSNSMLPGGYDDGTTNNLENATKEYSSFNSGLNAFCTINIPYGTTVTIPSGKTVVVGGVVNYPLSGCSQGHTSGAYAKINNNGTINISGGTLKVYGLISGNGELKVSSGSLYEPFLINDYNGGTNTEDIYKYEGNGNQFPFSRYGVINIQNKLTVNSDAEVYGITGLYFQEKSHSMNPLLIGNSEALINLNSGAVYERTFSPNGEDGEYNVTVTNGATFGYIRLKTEDGDVSSKDRYFSLPYNFRLYLNGGKYTIPQNVFLRLLPGAEVKIGSGAKLIDKGALLVYPSAFLTEKTEKPYPSTLPAQLNSSGTVILGENAVFAGTIKGGHVEYYNNTKISSSLRNDYGATGGYLNNLTTTTIYTNINQLGTTRENKSAGAPAGGPGGPAAPTQEEKVSVVIYKSKSDSTPLYTYSVKKDEGIQVPSTPKKDCDENYHYTFLRWYDSTTGSTASFAEFDKDTVIWAEYIEEAHTLADGTCTVCGYNNEKYQKEQLEQAAKNARIKAGVKNTKLSKKSIVKTGKKIKISWTKSNGYAVDYYEVFKSTKKGSFSSTPYYVTTSGTKTTYANSKGLKKGKTYYYKVRGVRIIDGQKVYTKTVTMSQKI